MYMKIWPCCAEDILVICILLTATSSENANSNYWKKEIQTRYIFTSFWFPIDKEQTLLGMWVRFNICESVKPSKINT